jgi:hypothetical protein
METLDFEFMKKVAVGIYYSAVESCAELRMEVRGMRSGEQR